jgi:hypothetical protein
MANAVSGTPLPGGSSSASDSKPSNGPPPPPKRRSEHPPAPPTAATLAAAQAAQAAASAERRAEYVPAPPRAPVELPKIPKLDVPDAVQTGGQRGSVPPPAVAVSGSSSPPVRSSSVPPPPPGPREARTTPPSAHASTEPGARSVGAFTRFGESIRTRLPVSVQERTEGVPAVGLIVGGGALAVLVLAAAGLTARTAYRAVADGPSESSTKVAEVAPATAATSGDEKTEPRSQAPATSEPKASAAGDEASVLLELGEHLLGQKKAADVPPLVARLIARDPTKKDDPRVGKLLLSAAASDDRKAAADSHALLTGPMGETGATLVYELSLKPGVRDGIRTRAQTWLASKDFERVASLPVFAAQKLRAAKTCEDKHALLDFAARAGGPHVLEYLKEVERKKACAPDDLEHCYPCMRNDNKLSDVITSLEKR